jgi:hypothetical protein
MDGVRAVLIDIDGVLTVSWKPLPGAVAAIEALRSADLPFALVTNTTSRTRARIAETLVDAGFPSGPTTSSAPPPPRPRTCASTTSVRRACCCPAATSPTISTGCGSSARTPTTWTSSSSAAQAPSSPTTLWTPSTGTPARRRTRRDAPQPLLAHRRRPAARRRRVPARFEKAADVEAVVLGKPSGAFSPQRSPRWGRAARP